MEREVCLLLQQYHSESPVLDEVEHVDLSLIGAAPSNYNAFCQAGENVHEGAIVLARKAMTVTRVYCSMLNFCVIGSLLSELVRIIVLCMHQQVNLGIRSTLCY